MAPDEPALLRVEVVYCPSADAVDHAVLLLPAGATLLDALRRLLERHPGIDLTQHRAGIWGRTRSLDEALHDGDRVELYRPLQVDPKEARRLRAARQGVSGRRSRSPTR